MKSMFTILATAYNEMQKHPNDFKRTLPICKEFVKMLFTDWNGVEELYIDKMPF